MRLPAVLTGLAAGVRCRGCGASGSLLCTSCALEQPPPLFDGPITGVDRVLARWAYDEIPRALILDLKIRGARLCASALADGIAHQARVAGLTGSVITWVPGRRKDMRVRGFDHAALLAQEVARRVGLPIRELLIRRVDTPDQTTLSAAERKHNLHGVFEATDCPRRVIVVDDLVTTGATGTACARSLRTAGAQEIELLVASRA